MADSDLRSQADRRFEEALARAGARDPRDFYRQRLRELRERDAAAYQRAIRYYEDRLIPAVAEGSTDPIAEWLEYGRVLATLVAPGRTVRVDDTGRAHDFDPAAGTGGLVLHVPTGTRDAVMVVGLPPQLSAAQRATYDLLVAGRRE